MKSKKKLLLLGVGAMGALALGVGATSTFAWYSANANSSLTANAKTVDLITASDTHYDVGTTVTVSAEFSAVSVASRNATKLAADANAKVPTWVAATQNPDVAAHFEDVELTNDSGETWAYTPGGLSRVNTITKDNYGVAKLTITLSSVDPIVLSSLTTNQVVIMTLTKDGNAKVLGQGNGSSDPASYAHADIPFVLTIAANGTYSATLGGAAKAETSNGSGVWEFTFLYGMAPKYTTEQADVVNDHSTDGLKVTASAAARQ